MLMYEQNFKAHMANRSTFEEISKEMVEHSRRSTWVQCQGKVTSLKAKLRETKNANQRSGCG